MRAFAFDRPAETADGNTLVQMAIVYRADRIALYRNGEPITEYQAGNIDLLSKNENVVVFGARHLGQRDNARFAGTVDDARIYARALTAEQLKALRPNQPSDVEPYAWWDFEGDKVVDRTGRFTLVGNAVKFTETGSVRMVARLLRPAAKPALLQVEVIDTGIGLTAEQALTRKFGRTGLGLTISKRLAEMLGGDITLDSEPGKGSTFSVIVETGDLEGVRLLESSTQAVAPATSAPAAWLHWIMDLLLENAGKSSPNYIGLTFSAHGPLGPRPSV